MTLKDQGDSVPSAQAGARERVLRGGRATKRRRASLKSPWRNVNLDRQSMRGQNKSLVDLKASDSENSPGSQKLEKKDPRISTVIVVKATAAAHQQQESLF